MRETLRAKRTLAGAAAGALVFSLMPGAAFADVEAVCQNAAEGQFDDVTEGGTHTANINCIAAYEITLGTGGGDYDPLGNVARDQMASFLVNFLETSEQTDFAVPEEDFFTDIEGTTHEENIKVLADLGITSGVTEDLYMPDAEVTREQMATFVAETIVAAGGDLAADPENAFTDDEGSVHEENINALAAADVVSGVTEDLYNPDGLVTRAQMGTFLAQAAGLLDDQGEWEAPRIPAQPGEPGQSVTSAPELVNFSTQQDGNILIASYTFDEAVAVDTATPGNFKLYSATNPADAATATTVELSADSDMIVLAEFALDSQAFAEMSVATVVAGAVVDVDGEENPEGARPVQDVTTAGGFTAAPDLLSVENFRTESGLNPDELFVDFVFDQEAEAVLQLDTDADTVADAADPSAYALVDVGGETVYSGGRIVSGDGETVHTLAFDLSAVDAASDVARGYIEQGTVASATGEDNPTQAAVVTGPSETPDLVSAEFDAESERVTYTFDEAVTLPDNTGNNFWVYNTSGTPTEATEAAVSANDNSVVIAGFADITESTVGAIVDEGAVQVTRFGNVLPNLTDEARTATEDVAFAAGETDAPDLQSATVSVSATNLQGEPTAYEAVYTFDEEVATTGAATLYSLYAEDGTQVSGNAIAGTDGAEVTVTFSTAADFDTVEAAVLATVAEDAAVDADGVGNPEGAVSVS